MKKMTRKTAVMLASAMMASAMMGAGVFADTTITEDPQQTPAQVPMTLTGSVSTNNSEATVSNDASLSKIWNVTIDTDGLNWEVTQTNNFTGGSYNINWDASTHRYVKTQTTGAGQCTSSITSVAEAEKSFTIDNDSNFGLTYDVSLVQGTDYATYFDSDISYVFTIANGNDSVPSGSFNTVTITMNPASMRVQYGNTIDAANFASASISLTAGTQYASNDTTYGLTN